MSSTKSSFSEQEQKALLSAFSDFLNAHSVSTIFKAIDTARLSSALHHASLYACDDSTVEQHSRLLPINDLHYMFQNVLLRR